MGETMLLDTQDGFMATIMSLSADDDNQSLMRRDCRLYVTCQYANAVL